jgi:hypothetical protein
MPYLASTAKTERESVRQSLSLWFLWNTGHATMGAISMILANRQQGKITVAGKCFRVLLSLAEVVTTPIKSNRSQP